jgi:GT2 family glycosyltransferase
MKQISFVINTAVNELNHISLLLKSLKLNLDGDRHEILVFIDNDNQGTYEYLKSIKDQYYDLKIITHKLPPCIGYSRNNNLLVELAKHDVVSYLQSDMIISPHYDTDVLKELKSNMILSATRVEPPLHGNSVEKITKDFGTDPLEFDLEKWNKYSITVKEDKMMDYFFAPITFYKSLWLGIGGYDTLFRRSREDSDLVQRCLHKGIQIKQTFGAIVYHFTCTSSRGKDWFKKDNIEAQNRVKIQNQADQIELKRFIRKWGGFNHGAEKLNKYDVVLEINNSNKIPVHIIQDIEPLFSKVFIDDISVRELLISNMDFNQNPANELLKFTREQWDKTSKYHNLVNFNDIFVLPDKSIFQYNVKLIIDGETLAQSDFDVINQIHKIIENYDKGDYEYGNIKLCIIKKRIIDNTICTNPDFDMNLLKIS